MTFPSHRKQYPDQTSTRMLRAIKAEAQGPLWNAAAAIQEYASRNRLIPSQSDAHQSTYNQYLVPWSLTSYARLEVVEEEIEPENDAVQPETSNNGPNLEVTPRGPSVMDDKCGNATGCERGESMERAIGQDSKPLDTAPADDPDQVHHVAPVAHSFPPPSSPPPAKPSFSVLGLASQVHHFEPVPPLFPLPSSLPLATPSFPVSGQTVPSFPPHHLDLVEPSFPIPHPTIVPFPIPHPTIPLFAAPGPAVPPFPVLERAVPTFPVLEPTSYVEDINDYANSLSLSPSKQQSPPRRDLYPVSRYHTPAQTPHFHGPRATHSNSLLVFSRPPSSLSTRQLHPPPSPHCDPPPSPLSSPPPSPLSSPPPSPPPSSPPPHYGSSEGVAPSSPVEEGTAARRHQFVEVLPFLEAVRKTWPSASQEKEKQSMVYRLEQMTLGKGEGTVADVGDEPLQRED